MKIANRLGRRGFLGLSAAAIGAGLSVGLVKLRPANDARFIEGAAFPEAPAGVALTFAGIPDGATARVWLHIQTPEGNLKRDLGRVHLYGGKGQLTTKLEYPFETRVPGEYSYYVEAVYRGRRAISEQPASYSVRKIWWFS